MHSKLLYLEDAYLQESPATIIALSSQGKTVSVILDQTIFYPQGGGQPSDVGLIKGKRGNLTVTQVSYNHGEPLHTGNLTGNLKVGDQVKLIIDWDKRFYHMRLHTAGHVLHEAVMKVAYGIEPISGMHGIGGHNYVKYQGVIDRTLIPEIESTANQIIAANKTITTKFVTLSELKRIATFIPANLPTDKPLRVMHIDGFPAMPDGGTQLKNTLDVGSIKLVDIDYADGMSIVKYTISSVQVRPVRSQISLDEFQHQLKSPITKSHLNYLTKLIPKLPPTDRPAAGKLLNQLKTSLHAPRATRHAPATTWLDVTLPGTLPPQGHLHPITQAIDEIQRIFESIGFTRVRYPEVDWDWYVFESLNMPPNHPARDEWETFFVDANPHSRYGSMVLTTHTSNGQVREMERVKHPPIRMINIAKCYRRQQDLTHTPMFHQFEGLVVDRGINIQHLKGTIDYFARKFYGPKAQSRLRPFHFQFTEPSFEVDFTCTMCEGHGCKFCKSGWHEVGGAGMVHPNVLSAGGIDPDIYTGFAFGWGIERTYTLKPGLKLDDIRLLYSNNLEFLSQF